MAEVAAPPVPGRPKAKKADGAAPAKRAAQKAAPKAKAVRETRPCACGCGTAVPKYFVPGHDSRFKSVLLQVERGSVELEKALPKKVRDQYVWKKRGLGFVPTKDYKGDPYVPKT
jgi:hypothetical protein